jgi:hypothetical protein
VEGAVRNQGEAVGRKKGMVEEGRARFGSADRIHTVNIVAAQHIEGWDTADPPAAGSSCQA